MRLVKFYSGETLELGARAKYVRLEACQVVARNEHFSSDSLQIEVLRINAFPPLIRGEQLAQEDVTTIGGRVSRSHLFG